MSRDRWNSGDLTAGARRCPEEFAPPMGPLRIRQGVGHALGPVVLPVVIAGDGHLADTGAQTPGTQAAPSLMTYLSCRATRVNKCVISAVSSASTRRLADGAHRGGIRRSVPW